MRDNVLAEAGAPYQAPGADAPFQLLVFGGSQGARFFAEFMPEAHARVAEGRAEDAEGRTQQCRPEDLEAVKAAYRRLGSMRN